ncbi:ferrous iron transport protein B [Moorella thermoacetica]|uniref:Ferrous iron transport protein B n=1 Tax=Neomoorella thermoacetica TaxID=1525 RepID=A0A1J5JGA7_NEOTH|nr:FeoB small GTPase domain-containing protein [Moorella thermoacetica]OIQ08562.1 ferrous iron transport protein B [Moorella thermoacetica]
MGLTKRAAGRNDNDLREDFFPPGVTGYLIALAGNPNAGKSTVFNALTGLRQHTGNWPGKTVLLARGTYSHRGETFTLVDLPGTYSLLATSLEEQVARDFICFGNPSVTTVVVDATCLERNLNLVLQVMEVTTRVVVCLNLMDEARRKNIEIDVPALARELGVPVVPAAARSGEGLSELKETISGVAAGTIPTDPRPVVYDEDIERAAVRLVRELRPLLKGRVNARWVALRLLEGDEGILMALKQHLGIPVSQLEVKLQLKGVPA